MTSRSPSDSKPILARKEKQSRKSNSKSPIRGEKVEIVGPGRPRSKEAHQAILNATLQLLIEVGYDRLTIAGVAKRAGVGKATIYRRWPSRAPLVIDAFELLPPLISPDTGNMFDDLVHLLKSYVHTLNSTPLALVLAVLAGERAHNPELSKQLEPLFYLRKKPMDDILARAVSRNELPRDIDLVAAADMILGPIVTRYFFSGNKLTSNDIIPFVEAALFGINRLRH